MLEVDNQMCHVKLAIIFQLCNVWRVANGDLFAKPGRKQITGKLPVWSVENFTIKNLIDGIEDIIIIIDNNYKRIN